MIDIIKTIHDKFYYKDGKVYRKSNNKEAGCNQNKYRVIKINYKKYLTHRVVWALHHNKFPDLIIDHINGIKNDNRIENLRECTQSENMRNYGLNKLNTSGFKNVVWNKYTNKWQVNLRVNGKKKYFGMFDDINIANKVAIKARKQFHKEFAKG